MRVNRTADRELAELIDVNRIDGNKYPVARGIAWAWSKWREKLYENDGNLFKAILFGNPGITNRMGRKIGENNVFSARRYNLVRNRIENIEVGELVEMEGIKTKIEIEERIGTWITEVEYGKISDIIKYIRNKFKPSWEMIEKGKNVVEILRKIKKGSKKFRQIISGRGSRSYM